MALEMRDGLKTKRLDNCWQLFPKFKKSNIDSSKFSLIAELPVEKHWIMGGHVELEFQDSRFNFKWIQFEVSAGYPQRGAH